VAPAMQERQLFEQLAKLRTEQMKLRAHASAGGLDAKGVERMRQIEVEATAAWSGIRSARAEGRAAHRARFVSAPALNPFRGLVPRKGD
jgi:hypothetical protein